MALTLDPSSIVVGLVVERDFGMPRLKIVR